MPWRYADLQNLDFCLHSCYDGSFARPPGRSVEVEFYSAWLCRSGGGRIVMRGESHDIAPARWWLLPPGRRRQHWIPSTRLLSVTFSVGNPYPGELLWPGRLPLSLDPRRYPRLETIALGLNREIERVFPGHDFMIHRQLLQTVDFLRIQQHLPTFLEALITALASEGIDELLPEPADAQARRLRHLLEQWPLDRRLDRTTIARSMGCSPVHLERLMRRVHGCSPSQFHERRRVARARLELQQAEARIKAVAGRLGFRSLSNFNRWFQRHNECNPSDYLAGTR